MIPLAHNDPELNGKFLGTISADFVKVSDILKEAAYQLKERDISNFPVFPVSKSVLPIGRILIGAAERPDLELQWNYHFSMLEELLQRGIVQADAEAMFREAYKNPEEYCCLFVVDPDFTNFVYIPYPED